MLGYLAGVSRGDPVVCVSCGFEILLFSTSRAARSFSSLWCREPRVQVGVLAVGRGQLLLRLLRLAARLGQRHLEIGCALHRALRRRAEPLQLLLLLLRIRHQRVALAVERAEDLLQLRHRRVAPRRAATSRAAASRPSVCALVLQALRAQLGAELLVRRVELRHKRLELRDSSCSSADAACAASRVVFGERASSCAACCASLASRQAPTRPLAAQPRAPPPPAAAARAPRASVPPARRCPRRHRSGRPGSRAPRRSSRGRC